MNRSLHRIIQKAFKAVASYKLLIVSSTSTKSQEMDYVVQEKFNLDGFTFRYLYDTETDTDSELEDDPKNYCFIPLVCWYMLCLSAFIFILFFYLQIEPEIEELVLESPAF